MTTAKIKEIETQIAKLQEAIKKSKDDVKQLAKSEITMLMKQYNIKPCEILPQTVVSNIAHGEVAQRIRDIKTAGKGSYIVNAYTASAIHSAAFRESMSIFKVDQLEPTKFNVTIA